MSWTRLGRAGLIFLISVLIIGMDFYCWLFLLLIRLTCSNVLITLFFLPRITCFIGAALTFCWFASAWWWCSCFLQLAVIYNNNNNNNAIIVYFYCDFLYNKV